MLTLNLFCFDLDETLYPRETGLMAAISQRIFLFMTQKVGMPQMTPWKKRGTTTNIMARFAARFDGRVSY